MKKACTFLLLFACLVGGAHAQTPKFSDSKIKALKKEATEKVQDRAKMAQVMVDKIFSFSELGFQETDRAYRATTGRMQWLWQRRLPTKASLPAQK